MQGVVAVCKSNAGKSGIVYCLTKTDCKKLAELLRADGVSALDYHGDLSPEERRNHQDAWQDGSASVMCATDAFGLGIDKADVRFVCHQSPPFSMQHYYQQCGRAGRDGGPAECTLFWHPSDHSKVRSHPPRSPTCSSSCSCVAAHFSALTDCASPYPHRRSGFFDSTTAVAATQIV